MTARTSRDVPVWCRRTGRRITTHLELLLLWNHQLGTPNDPGEDWNEGWNVELVEKIILIFIFFLNFKTIADRELLFTSFMNIY